MTVSKVRKNTVLGLFSQKLSGSAKIPSSFSGKEFMSDSIIFMGFLHIYVSLKMSLCLNVYLVLLIGTVVLPFPFQSFYYFKVTKGISINDVMFPKQQAQLLLQWVFLFWFVFFVFYILLFLTAFR